MILHGVRWRNEGNEGFMRSEFRSAEEAIEAAKKLDAEGEGDVNIKLVDTVTGKFVGELHFK